MKKSLIFLALLILSFVLLEGLAWFVSANDYKKRRNETSLKPIEYKLPTFLKDMYSLEKFCDDEDTDCINLRNPILIGNDKPITIFGGSFAFGHYLTQQQNFAYKLAEQLNRPVYNRAIAGLGINNMLYQITSSKFYRVVPPSDLVFYVMIDDHYRRSMIKAFHPVEHYESAHYKYNPKKDKMEITNFIPVIEQLEKLYIVKLFRNYYVQNYLKDVKNADKITEDMLIRFIKSREKLEKRWGNKIDFVVVFYQEISFSSLLKEKLEKNGFIVVSTDELTKEDLNNEFYKQQDNGHPTEEAWNLLTPLIIQKLYEKGVKL